MSTVNIEFKGLFENKNYLSFKSDLKKSMFKEVEEAYVQEGNNIRKLMQAQASSVFKVKKKSFLSSFSYKIYNEKKDSPPSVLFGNKIGFMGIHQYGGTISSKGKLLLIPTSKKRIGRKTFNQIISRLIQSNNAYFKKIKNGRLGLFSEVIDENLNDIQKTTGKKKLVARKEYLIATAMKSLTIKKKLQTIEIVEQNSKKISDNIQNRFNSKF